MVCVVLCFDKGGWLYVYGNVILGLIDSEKVVKDRIVFILLLLRILLEEGNFSIICFIFILCYFEVLDSFDYLFLE